MTIGCVRLPFLITFFEILKTKLMNHREIDHISRNRSLQNRTFIPGEDFSPKKKSLFDGKSDYFYH